MWFKKKVVSAPGSNWDATLAFTRLSNLTATIAADERKFEIANVSHASAINANAIMGDLAHKRIDALLKHLGVELEYVPARTEEQPSRYTVKTVEKNHGRAKK